MNCISSLGLLVFPFVFAIGAMAQSSSTAPTGSIKLMSFNLRYGNAPDGENHWDKRKTLLLDTIRKDSPDLLGTQECIAEQFDFLQQNLPEYHILGVGRNDGKRDGEFSAILFRRDRFELIDSGTFWLSETPDTAGTKGWDAAFSRVVTWAKLRDRSNQREFVWLNTHFDHHGEQARIESAKLMAKWIIEKHYGGLALITGDFNSDEKSAAYRTLVGEQSVGKFTDTYRALHPAAADEATFHDFTGDTKGERIDWILCSNEFSPLEATIDHASKDGRYPSDHFPVTAKVGWK